MSEETKPALPPRPLPSVPAEEPPFGELDTGPAKKNRWSALSAYRPGRNLENWKEKYDEVRQKLDTRPLQSRSHAANLPAQGQPGSPVRRSGESQTPRLESETPTGFYITLIRRDPTHGTQWNVATISTPRMDGSPIDIDVSTPGYNRFAAAENEMSMASPQGRPAGPRKFHRQLCVSRPHDDPRGLNDPFGGDSGVSKLKSGYYAFTSPWNGTCTFATSVNGRSLKCKHMIPSPHSAVTIQNQPPNPALTVAEIRFNTPFQAGHLNHPTHSGSSHISPFALSQTQIFQPGGDTSPTSPSGGGGAGGGPGKRASLANFLNPNVYSRPRSRSNTTASTSHSNRLSTASRSSTSSAPDFEDRDRDRDRDSQSPLPHAHPPALPPRSRPITADGEPEPEPSAQADEERLDLSLAREPAGGGMRGKSAKLGKLVIEDEGIKMLDLVVAACMGVWWKGYYY